MAANLLPNGSATGQSRFGVGVEGEGPVIQVVPPSGAVDFWCITVDRTDAPGNHINWYIRDVGDGKTTFDQISAVSGPTTSVDCTKIPLPLGIVLTLTSGDFKARFART